MTVPDPPHLDETCIDPDPSLSGSGPPDDRLNNGSAWHHQHTASMASSLYDPPLAPSVHSSNMSSLRRLAERIKKDRRTGQTVATAMTATESRPNSVFSSSFSRQSWVSRRDYQGFEAQENGMSSLRSSVKYQQQAQQQAAQVQQQQQQRDEVGILTKSLVSLSTQGYEKPVSPS